MVVPADVERAVDHEPDDLFPDRHAELGGLPDRLVPPDVDVADRRAAVSIAELERDHIRRALVAEVRLVHCSDRAVVEEGDRELRAAHAEVAERGERGEPRGLAELVIAERRVVRPRERHSDLDLHSHPSVPPRGRYGRRLGFLALGRIVDALVVDPRESEDELLLDPGEFAERERRLVELTVRDLGLDDPVDEGADPLRPRALDAPGPRLARVAE